MGDQKTDGNRIGDCDRKRGRTRKISIPPVCAGKNHKITPGNRVDNDSAYPEHIQKGGAAHMERYSIFKAFIRFLLNDLQKAANERDEEKRTAKLQEIIRNLNLVLEDS